MPSVAAGLVAGALIVLLEFGFFHPNLPAGLRERLGVQPGPWQGLLASVYGAIGEEILLRLGLMTLLAWAGAQLTRTRPPGAGVLWAAGILAALLFGIAHLPVTALLVPLTPLVVARALVLNGVGGVLYGWLYWRRGLDAAMAAHFGTDLVLHILAPLFLRG